MTRNKILTALTALAMLCAVGCTDEESDLGVNLADPNTIYHGQHETLYANDAYSMRDDSLVTSNANYCVVGKYSDATFGKVSATIYTQIALPSDANGINLAADAVIDSVKLFLVKDALFPDTAGTYNLHFEIMPLDEELLSDTTYYGFDTLKVCEGVKYFDDIVTIGATDTVITFPLGGGIGDMLHRSSRDVSAAQFLSNVKGLRIRVLDAGSDDAIVAFSFAATKTRLTAWYHVPGDTNEIQYHFVVGTGAKRFMHFKHDYSAAVFGNVDSIPGNNRLYLEPFGGYNVVLNFDDALRTFHAAHPRAVVHYAELLLPLADEAPAIHPDSLMAFSLADGTSTLLPDLRYNMGGDGAYNADSNYYRLRVSLYLQQLLRQGSDQGTELMLYYSRRHPAARTVVNGTATTKPVSIRLTFTE